VKPLDASAIRGILVRGTNWVGDAVMSVPALRLVRARFPSARITLLVRPWVKDVHSAVDFIDELVVYDRGASHRGPAGFLRLARELRRRRFDLALLLQNAFEAALLAWCAHIPLRLGYARDARSWLLTHPCRIDPPVRAAHQVYYYLGILSAAGLAPPRLWEDKDYRPSIRIGVSDADLQSARRLLAGSGIADGDTLIGLNPGASYGPAKRWLPDRYAALADRIAERYRARIVLFGAAAEREIAGEVARKMRRPAVVLAGRTRLGELMGLIAQCRLLVTNDSGPMHLAAALGVPQVAIFGSSSEVATGPLGPDARIVKHPVGCSPCFLRRCPIDFRCMTRIAVEDVFAAAASQLEAPTV